MRFRDKVVLITGASGGIGRCAARRFHEAGATLVLSDLSVADCQAVAGALSSDILVVAGDVTREADHAAMIAATGERHGRLDVAINNAGILGPLAAMDDAAASDFDRVMAVNARGVFLAMKHQIPLLRASGGGAVLNVASVAGLIGARAFGAYVASKHAVIGLTRTAAIEEARYGIRVNALCPSFAESPMLAEVAAQLRPNDDPAEAYRRLGQGIPMGRVATADDVVGAMMTLCDPANTFMTGQAVAVDGGLTAG